MNPKTQRDDSASPHGEGVQHDTRRGSLDVMRDWLACLHAHWDDPEAQKERFALLRFELDLEYAMEALER